MPPLPPMPTSLAIEQDEDGTWIVSDDVLLVYGDGATIIEAIHDYATSLGEWLWLVERDGGWPRMLPEPTE
jgi:hypothetical protein